MSYVECLIPLTLRHIVVDVLVPKNGRSTRVIRRATAAAARILA
jgi:hypothetical protein